MEDPILSYIGPRRLIDGLWYPEGGVEPGTLTTETILNASMTFDSGQKTCLLRDAAVTSRSKRPNMNMDSRVTIWSIVIHGAENKRRDDVYLLCNYMPKAIAAHQETQDALMPHFGLPKGAIYKIKAGYNGKFTPPLYPLKSGKENAFLNPTWIKTVPLLNAMNIRNGLVQLPRDLCEVHPLTSSFIWKGPNPPGDAIYSWIALPPNHILTLYLENFVDWDKSPDGSPHPIPFYMGDKILCWILPDREVELLAAQLLTSWSGMVDLRPLGDVSLSIEPDNKKQPFPEEGVVLIEASFIYTSWLDITQETIARLHPILPDRLKRTTQQ